jgi:hypothetical protein
MSNFSLSELRKKIIEIIANMETLFVKYRVVLDEYVQIFKDKLNDFIIDSEDFF